MMKGERYRFVAMNETYAREIVDTWRYEGEYAVYDYLHEAEHMLDAEGWGTGIFAVLDEEAALVGELSIEFCDSRGDYIRLGVAAFNRRAISVYDRCGFIEFQRADGEIGGRTFACIYMRKRIDHEPRALEA